MADISDDFGLVDGTTGQRLKETVRDNGNGSYTREIYIAGGAVVGAQSLIRVQPVLSTSAYAAGNCVGSTTTAAAAGKGIFTLASALRVNNGSGVLLSLALTDHAHNAAAFDLLFFSATPAATFTDKSAFPTLAQSGDDTVYLGRVSIAASDWVTVGGSGTCTKSGLNLGVAASDGTPNLYMAINLTSGTPTWAASDLNLIVTILQN